jgi:surfeit locus 1 family protein
MSGMLAGFRFRPPWWAWLLAAAGLALFLRLGVWQLDRAAEKKAIISAYQQAAKSVPLDFDTALAAGRPAAGLYARAVSLTGRFEAGRNLLLDNQVVEGRPGYRVWTPLRLSSGRLALVDRGWLPMNPDRRILPAIATPAGPVSLRGVWQPLPRPGLRLAPDDCDRSRWPRVVQYPLFEELQCLLGPDLAEGLLWLDPAEPHGFVRDWVRNEFPPERHYGYALQWFALAGTTLVLFIVLNFRRIRP